MRRLAVAAEDWERQARVSSSRGRPRWSNLADHTLWREKAADSILPFLIGCIALNPPNSSARFVGWYAPPPHPKRRATRGWNIGHKGRH
jgi:hypothetical protein